MRPRLMAMLKRLRADRAGIAALEFALIGPTLILAYFGMVELCGAMLAERKTAHVASSVADLVAQMTTIHDSDMTDILSVANTVMSPLPTTALSIRVVSVVSDVNGNLTDDWGAVQGTFAAVAHGTPDTLPAGLISPGQSIIKAEVKYPYHSAVDYLNPNGITFDETFYLRPRISNTVTRVTP